MDLDIAGQLSKLAEYRRDPIKFFKEQYWIKHPVKQLIRFSTFPAQEECIRDFIRNRFNIILKSRQIGISTVVAGYALWKAVFWPHQEIRVIATQKSTAQIIIEIAWLMVKNLEPWVLPILQAEHVNEAKHTIELANGSKLKSFGQSKGDNTDTGIGNALSLLIVDECAVIKNMQDIWTAAYPSISQGGNCIILSTPRGVQGFFYDAWRKAIDKKYERGEIPFRPIKLMWWENLERIQFPETPLEKNNTVPGGFTNSWARKTFANLSKKEIAREYACDFILSGETALDPERIKIIEERYVKDPIIKEGRNEEYWIWQEPRADRHYIIAADTATGEAKDYDVFIIICIETYEEVAEFQGKMDMGKFGQELVFWSIKYNNALIVPENNETGKGVLQKILDMQAQGIMCNLFWFDNKFKGLVYEDFRESTKKEKKVPGWPTITKTRQLVLENLLEELKETSKPEIIDQYGNVISSPSGLGLVIHSSRIITELNTWGWFNGRLDHAPQKNDDLIMALAIGTFIKTVYSKITDNENRLAMSLLNQFSTNQRTADMTFGVYINKGSQANPFEAFGEDWSVLIDKKPNEDN